MRKFAKQIDEQLHCERERVTSLLRSKNFTTAKENNLNPQDVLFVGDSLTDDVIGPKSVGMKTALVDRAKRSSFAEQDYTFTELTDLLKITEL